MPRRLLAAAAVAALGACPLVPSGAQPSGAPDAPPALETGAGGRMPPAWVDRETGHRVVRLTPGDGPNESFYFHNNPFVTRIDGTGTLMVYSGATSAGSQLFTVDLATLATSQLTTAPRGVRGEIVAPRRREVIYQRGDTVFATHVDTRATRVLKVLPADLLGGVTTLNADETMLAGATTGPEERAILARYPEKRDFFDRIFAAHVPHTLFTLDLATGALRTVHRENTWLGHVQFSPTDPKLLMFCHEGPWHLVDRIWTIDVGTGAVQQIHHRTVDREIAGHEFWSPDGRTIWYDLQVPRGETFYVAGQDARTAAPVARYQLARDEWSIHYNVSRDGRMFAGDGGDSGQVAHARDGRWIYLFRPEGNGQNGRFAAERLVSMRRQTYHLEPNVRFSPDARWVIFRGNFEGRAQAYAVEVARADAGGSSRAAAPPPPAAPHAPATVLTAARLRAVGDSLAAPGMPGSLGAPLGEGAGYTYSVTHRDGSGGLETHAAWTDVIVVQSGSAAFVTGGTVDGAREATPGEWRGGTHAGGTRAPIRAGDVVVVPAGTPHQMFLAPGEQITFLTFKVAAPSASPVRP